MVIWLIANASAAAGLSVGFQISAGVLRQLPGWAQLFGYAFEVLGLVVFILSLPFTLFEQRLNFRLRWYMVTDRSLRIRSGIWSTQELTTTFANIQEIRVTSGPLQKLLGLADVEVHSAGGGGKKGEGGGHIARFEGVDIANQIRDLIVDRLRDYRGAGLGETEHVAQAANVDAIAAANTVLEEARALRAALQKH
ncbi:MAG: PH domain-containing protein [Candidatus Solibacter sp.]